MTMPAHLLFHMSGIDTLEDRYIPGPDRSKRIEILCNRVAARFLVPEAAFAEALAQSARLRARARDSILDTC